MWWWLCENVLPNVTNCVYRASYPAELQSWVRHLAWSVNTYIKLDLSSTIAIVLLLCSFRRDGGKCFQWDQFKRFVCRFGFHHLTGGHHVSARRRPSAFVLAGAWRRQCHDSACLWGNSDNVWGIGWCLFQWHCLWLAVRRFLWSCCLQCVAEWLCLPWWKVVHGRHAGKQFMCLVVHPGKELIC